MILIAGGTGTLGTHVVRLLAARGFHVRVLTRDSSRAQHLEDELVEIALGDVRDPDAVARAMAGADTVISAIHGFGDAGDYNPRTVDYEGNTVLIQAARAAGVQHFILVSVQGAAADHPIELFRMKYLAEQELNGSGIPWTILRPTAFMETWADVVAKPLLETGKTRLFGRGLNPINFVSAWDVARFIEMTVIDASLRGKVLEVGGPKNLTMREFVRTFETVTGRTGATRHVSLPLMRVMSILMRPIKPALAGQIQAAVVMDTRDMTADESATSRTYPSITPTSLEEFARGVHAAASPAVSTSIPRRRSA
ncbi:MAG: SDR family oxidoreductase [Chloroflexota bacterium]